MSENNPPNVAPFNGIAYNPSFYSEDSTGNGLTLDQAKLYFLEYPIAQPATEYMSSLNVSGTTTANSIVSSGQIIQTLPNNNTVLASPAISFSSGQNNTILGKNAGFSSNSGSFNTFVGTQAGASTTSGFQNTCIGAACFEFGTGSENTAVGASCFNDGSFNTCVGIQAMGNSGNTSQHNSAFGGLSMGSLTTGNRNNSLGFSSLQSLTTGSNTIAIGYQAMQAGNVISDDNIGIGTQSLYSCSSGTLNIGISNSSQHSLTSGSRNISMGNTSLYSNQTGNLNIALGDSSGYYNLGSNNIYIGQNTGQLSADSNVYINSIAIGSNVVTTASNQCIIGNSSTTSTSVYNLTDNGNFNCTGNGVVSGTFSAGATGVGNLTSTGTFSVVGNSIFTSGTSLFSEISEKFLAINSGTNAFTLDYSNGNVFYLNTAVLNANFSVALWNLTSTTNNSRVITLIYATTGKYYPTSVTAFTDAGSTSITLASSTPLYNGGTPVIATSTIMISQFSLIRLFASNYVMATVGSYF